MQMITIAGNLGNDAELRSSQKGDAFAAFSVGVSKGRDTPTTWYRCTLWGKRGETLAQYLTKGSKITVVGEFQARAWEKDGKSGTSLEIRVSEIALQGGDSGGGQRRQGNSYGPQGNAWREAPEDPHARFGGDEDLPF